MSATVCVVIVNWNGGDFLADCLTALAGQSVPAWQTIVVDNASTDSSVQMVTQRFPDITLIRSPHNLGFAAANNLAVAQAGRCDWIALLNPDAFPAPDWLEKLLGAAHLHSAYSFFGSRMLMAEAPHLLDGTGDVYHSSGLSWRRGHACRAADSYLHDEEIFSPCAAAALYRWDIFQLVGGFDEDYFCYFEDTDLSLRLRLAGERCLYVADAVVRHVGSALTGRQSRFSIYHGHRNLVWAYVKNMPGWLLWLYLPQHLLLNLVELAWFSLHGQGRVICQAKWDALTGLPRAWRKRRQVQAARRISIRDFRRTLATGRPRIRQ